MTGRNSCNCALDLLSYMCDPLLMHTVALCMIRSYFEHIGLSILLRLVEFSSRCGLATSACVHGKRLSTVDNYKCSSVRSDCKAQYVAITIHLACLSGAITMEADSAVHAVTDIIPDECTLQRLHNLAGAAAEEKSNQLRKRLGNYNLQVTCRYNIY